MTDDFLWNKPLTIYKNEVMIMDSKEILEQVLKLKPEEKYALLEDIINSLDKPDKELDEIWAEEAECRLVAYRKGSLEGVPMEDVFKEK